MEKTKLYFPGFPGILEFNMDETVHGTIKKFIPFLQNGWYQPGRGFDAGQVVTVIKVELNRFMPSGIGVWIWDGKNVEGMVICSSLITVHPYRNRKED